MVIKGTIVFFGSGPVAAASLEYLSSYFTVESIVTKATPPHHKGIAPVEQLASRLQLPVVFANNKQQIDDLIDSRKFHSKLGILVDYGVILSQKVINHFEMGIVNSHFSLLPQWRGADPITFAILSGQQKTGVSLMVIEPSLDTGRLITRKSIAIKPDDTSVGLTCRLIELSNQLLHEFVPLYMSGKIKPKRQPHPDRATYSRKLVKDDGLIDWKKPAVEIERQVRAFRGWPGSRTKFSDKDIIVIKAHVSRDKQTVLDTLCCDENYLVIDELIAPSGRTMKAQDFLNGYS